MKNIKHIVSIVAIFLFIGCENFETDLEVQNSENPDTATLTTDVSALEALSTTVIFNWWNANHQYSNLGIALTTMSDAATCSWGNAGMRDLSSQPRVAYNNQASYGNAGFNETFFNAIYSILNDSNTLIQAVNNGTAFEDPKRIEAIGRFGQALSVGYAALVYDQAWLSDENGALNNGKPVDYKDAMVFALEKLDLAISIAEANNFDLAANTIPGHTYNSVDLASFMNSMGARMLTMNARNTTERDAINWTKVLGYANKGISRDFEVTTNADTIWDDYKWVLCQFGWARTDMYAINLMDPNTPSVWPAGTVTIAESTSADARLLSDYEYLTSQDFNPARGDYHYSSYRYKRYDFFLATEAESMPDYTVSENDMYKAEAMLRTSDLTGAATVLNMGTRKIRGNLPDVSSTDAIAIANAIHYERIIEFPLTGMALPFFEMRKEGLLQKGTFLHYPVPGKSLNAVPLPVYTFGGTTGTPDIDYSNGGWEI
ncbi:hypothetical protein [Tenacibaculum haliotis]|uniref:hypothetical protein n=1 Tax=Tenacibaculum haliotis TaxID=1888914 RepID=UPI0021AF72A3|nr:hypothetical protein [Tenacibaculum haliotis]MCT4697867.1 hypothetical protein [Tenacibaculum haliotis]